MTRFPSVSLIEVCKIHVTYRTQWKKFVLQYTLCEHSNFIITVFYLPQYTMKLQIMTPGHCERHPN